MTSRRLAGRFAVVAILAAFSIVGGCGKEGDGSPGAKTSYEVILLDAGDRKVDVARVVVRARRLGPAEARSLVERPPPTTIKAGLTKADAEALLARLREAGARAEVR